MKELLLSLLAQLRQANGPTRVVLAAGALLAVAIAGGAAYRAAHPSMVLLYSDLDSEQFAAVQGAIAGKSIRFETSQPPGPYSIWVERGRRYEALHATALDSALVSDPRGITTTSAGTSSVFLSSGERQQQMLKRMWGEVEQMLEVFPFVGKAKVASSVPNTSSFVRSAPPTVSVVLKLLGTDRLDREQSDMVAQVVRFSFNVPVENVAISDQHGRRLFDGSRDMGMSEILAHQEEFDRKRTARVQDFLDRVYGPGVVGASVHGEWTYERIESVDESIDPSTKVPLSEVTVDTETPQVPAGGLAGVAGGPTGTASNVDPVTSLPAADTAPPATTSESTKSYAVGRSTTHRLQDAPVLKRLTVTVFLDQSLADQGARIEQAIKDLAGFDESRSDKFSLVTTTFQGLDRDADGQPLEREPVELPEPLDPRLTLLVERGVEIASALGFLIVLLLSLRRSKRTRREHARAAAVEARESAAEVELPDPEAVARARVEKLVKEDPEKVSALLSRWARDRSTVGAGR